MAIPRKQIQQLEGHKSAVHFVTYSRDGIYCLSAGSDRTVKLWNPQTGFCVKTYNAHGKDVFDIAMYLYFELTLKFFSIYNLMALVRQVQLIAIDLQALRATVKYFYGTLQQVKP